jgi:cytochrome P450
MEMESRAYVHSVLSTSNHTDVVSHNISVYRSSETRAIVPFLVGEPLVYTSNLDVAKQIVAGGVKSTWIKPENASRALLIWGMNLFASEKETWRRHRRIMGPAFNNKTCVPFPSRSIRCSK